MLARDEQDRLLEAMVDVYTESAGGEIDAELMRRVGRRPPAPFAGMLSVEEEDLVAAVSAALGKIAATVAREVDGLPAESTIGATLGGAEMLMRGEILAGNVDGIPGLLPSFAYLVTMPFLSEKDALRLSQQVEALLKEATEGQAG
jgi:hypothetical protein